MVKSCKVTFSLDSTGSNEPNTEVPSRMVVSWPDPLMVTSLVLTSSFVFPVPLYVPGAMLTVPASATVSRPLLYC